MVKIDFSKVKTSIFRDFQDFVTDVNEAFGEPMNVSCDFEGIYIWNADTTFLSTISTQCREKKWYVP